MKRVKDGFQQIEQNYSFEKREQKLRKVFYVVFILFIIAGILGLFGNGVLSKKHLEEEAFSLEYQSLIRTATPSKLEFVSKIGQTPLSISFGKDYLRNIEVQNIVPQPDSVGVTKNELIYHFAAEKGGLISFYVEPAGIGPQSMEVGVNDKALRLNQFVYF